MKMIKRMGLWSMAMALLVTMTGAAQAETTKDRVYTRLTGEEMQEILQDLGYRAQLEVDNVGDPLISSTASGYKFRVLFYDCENGKGCNSIQFWAGFDTDEPGDIAEMNQWNAEKRFGKAYIDDENDPIIEMHYNIAGGVTRDNIEDILEWWEIVVGEFGTFIGF